MDIRILTELLNEVLRLLVKRNEVKTPVMTNVVLSGSVAAGYTSVTMTTSADFAGTILGLAVAASTTYTFSSNGNPLSAIAYTRSAGSITIIAM